MNILIVDDELPARGELRFIVQDLLPEAEISEASNGAEALKYIRQNDFAIVFLDVDMPGLNGLKVAEKISASASQTRIIFATAYNEHALQAFELAAFDYLLKPFDEERIAQTIKRFRQETAEEEQKKTGEPNLPKRSLKWTKLWGERENEIRVLIDYRQILWAEADAKKTFIQTATGENLIVRFTLKNLEDKLKNYGFARVHKSYLVNLNCIAEVVPWFSGTYLIRMADKKRTEIPLSRRFARVLKDLTGLH